METKEDLLHSLANNVVQLVKDYQMSHKEIKEHIYQCLFEESKKLPMTDVLYNNIHGGYGFSRDFNNSHYFERTSKLTNRVCVMNHIKDYGARKYSELPFIARLISIYTHYNLKDAFRVIKKIDALESTVIAQQTNLKSLLGVDDLSFGDEERTESFEYKVYDDHFKRLVARYTKSSLIHCFESGIEKNLQSITNLKEALQLTDDIVGKIKTSLKYSFPEEVENNKKPWYDRNKWEMGKDGHTMSFIEAIDFYGERHWAIWKCQQRFDEAAMRFLIQHPDVLPVPEAIDQMTLEDITTSMGLMCASGRYCNLVIGKAPQLVDWYIGEYDGLESICIPDSDSH